MEHMSERIGRKRLRWWRKEKIKVMEGKEFSWWGMGRDCVWAKFLSNEIKQ